MRYLSLITLMVILSIPACSRLEESAENSDPLPNAPFSQETFAVLSPIGKLYLTDIPANFRVTGLSSEETFQKYSLMIHNAHNDEIALINISRLPENADATRPATDFSYPDFVPPTWPREIKTSPDNQASLQIIVKPDHLEWLRRRITFAPPEPGQKLYRLPQSRLPLAIPDQENTIGISWHYDASQQPPAVILECRNIDGGISQITIDRKAGSFSLPQEQPEFLEDSRTLVCRLEEEGQRFLYLVRRERYQLQIYKQHENSPADSARLLETFFLPLAPRVLLTTSGGP